MSGPTASPTLKRVERAGALITAELEGRPRRPPDFEAENDALHGLAQALVSSDSSVLQTLADIALKLCNASHASIYLLETDGDQKPALRWAAFSNHGTEDPTGNFIPFDNSPAGVALELSSAQLFAFPERYFSGLGSVLSGVVEELVVPIPGTPESWGTLSVMCRDEQHRFDAEHLRILTSLANFTCAALTISKARKDAEVRAHEAEVAKNALAAAEARKDDFIAQIGHELRNPIGPIDSALTAARKLASDNSPVLSALSIAERQTRQLKRLVSDLLDASRIRHGKLSVRRSESLLSDIVKDATAAVRTEADRRQHQLHTILPTYPVTVFADSVRLTQVLSNVLSNAVKYTPAGGEITITVDAPDPATIPEDDSTLRETVITVRDTGIGIAPVLLPTVFDMFTQSSAAQSRAEGGLGIGLSVVKFLVSAHKGHVAISSPGPGKGTEVTIRLPIVCRSKAEPGVATMRRTMPARILLVDDNADATEALSVLLSLEGHEVKRALCGPEALSIVNSFAPDVALIDISMPGMDGHELARLLRQQTSCAVTKLVALTGYTVAVSEPDGGKGEFDYHLVKPLTLDDLAEVLRQS
ncbi:hybrid sensor histidine kinase/response regulator [Trinickia violacea]|uniref:histidine kinase n=1 Tax=Trinickia violacea TaxID=2571746 RepID=A0A4P8J160_9BURK|nr:hybrid sensor histidine kinase/response regulator [Trinickia violacea]QCP54701.1 hybrid sensor histidine kinase/response regulator [Trinickia violacea]